MLCFLKLSQLTALYLTHLGHFLVHLCDTVKPVSPGLREKRNKVKVLVTQSYPCLCDAMDCILPGSSVHGVLQARVLEWVALPSPGDLPNPGIKPRSPASKAGSSTCHQHEWASLVDHCKPPTPATLKYSTSDGLKTEISNPLMISSSSQPFRIHCLFCLSRTTSHYLP